MKTFRQYLEDVATNAAPVAAIKVLKPKPPTQPTKPKVPVVDDTAERDRKTAKHDADIRRIKSEQDHKGILRHAKAIANKE